MAPLVSVSEAFEAIGFGRWQVWMLCLTGCAWVTFAAEVVMVGFLGPAVACDWGLSEGQQSVLQAIGSAGSLVGLYAFGAAADAVGRRPAILASAVLQCAFGAASAAAPNYGSLLFFRFMHGVAVAGALTAIILFAEMVPPTNRARWSTLMQFWSLPGYLYEAGIAWATLPHVDGWRWMCAALVLPPALLLLATPLLWESPFWLTSRGRHAQAESILARIARFNRWHGCKSLELCLGPRAAATGAAEKEAAPDGSVCANDEPAKDNASTEAGPAEAATPTPGAAGSSAWRRARRAAAGVCVDTARGFQAMFRPSLLRTTLLLFGIWACSGFVYLGFVVLTPAVGNGDGAVTGCNPDGTAGWDDADFTAVMATSAAEAPGYIAVIILSDWIGRRWTLDALFATCAVSSTLLACRTWTYGWQLAILIVARAGIAGVYSCLYVFTLEVYPTNARNFAAGISDGWGRIGAFASPFAIVPLVNDDGLWKVATILASLCAAALLCCLLLPMDTMRRALSRRATPLRMPTLGRTPTFVLERSSVCSEGQSPGEAALARRDRGDAAAAAAEP